jgi:adenine-specific DNA-methyltransferase
MRCRYVPDIARVGTEMTDALTLPKVTKRYVEVTEAKAGGVTYTPLELADFVADQMLQIADLPTDRPIRVLDPAVGHGELLHRLLERLSGTVEVYGFETDASALDVATSRLMQSYPDARLHLVEGSFLDHVLDDFSDGLFPRGEKYDLIIANPPYVRTQIIGAERAQELASQFGLAGRVDLYFAFLLGMARVLAPSGSAGIIVSNRFMTTRAGGTIREALARSLRLHSVFDLGDTKLFDAAVLPAVIVANGRMGAAPVAPVRFTTIYEAKTDSVLNRADNAIAALQCSGLVGLPDGRTFEVLHGTLHDDTDPSGVWRLSSDDVSAWLDAVEANTWARFGDIGKVRVGVKTCADKVFIRQHWQEPLELLRPLTTHKIARRFRADPAACPMQILYPHEAVDGRRVACDLNRYPASRSYLEAHRETLEGRSYVIQGGRSWYEIWVPQHPDDWHGPKLVFRDISERPTFWIDLDDTIVNGDCYWIKPKTEMIDTIWLALAVANSTFIEQFYDRRFNNKLYAGRRRFITQYVEQFPLPNPNTRIGVEIISKSKMIYECTPSEGAEALEDELDAMVWAALTGSERPARK